MEVSKLKFWLFRLAKWLWIGFLILLLVCPLVLYVLLRWGWPPVIGNLAAARAMEQYAAQVHPEWETERHWAGYDLVGDGYYLSFSDGSKDCGLEYGAGAPLVKDEEREEALRAELNINKALRATGVLGGHTYWSARWSPETPEQAIVSVDVDFYGRADEPVPDETAIREKMADQAMAVYEIMAAHSPIHKLSVHYHHEGTENKKGVMLWNSISADLPQGETLTREHILNGELVTN